MLSQEHAFVFGSFWFRPRRQLLLGDGRPIKLGCRAMDVLHLLLKHAGETVSNRAFQQSVWPDSLVHKSNLKVHICSLRRALGDTSPQPTYIATVAGRGYRFIAPVSIEAVTADFQFAQQIGHNVSAIRTSEANERADIFFITRPRCI